MINNGFDVAELLGDRSFDLVIGNTYVYKFGQVRLDSITVHPSFSFKKKFGLFPYLEYRVEVRVSLSEKNHWFVTTLSDFIDNTIEVYRTKNALNEIEKEI